MADLARPELVLACARGLRRNPVVALLGPRQCGKSTLARHMLAERSGSTWFDLEDPADLAALDQPMTALRDLKGLVVLDEVQRRPDLFPILRVLADRKPARAHFLVLGSASPELLRQTSESLAGRVELIEMGGFDLDEVGRESWRTLWLRGGLPRSYLAGDDDDSRAWREDFIRTFLERDLPQLGLALPALAARRFWTMVAHYHGQTWNSSEVGSSLGVSDQTARRWLELLAGTYVVRVLEPWFENLGKRQRKAPKVYVRDSGLLHSLLGVPGDRILSHPKAGASWEGFAIEHVLRHVDSRDAYYWAIHGGTELDLLVTVRGKRVGLEMKLADAPKLTRSMSIALNDLRLHRLLVVYPGETRYALADRIEVVPLGQVREALRV